MAGGGAGAGDRPRARPAGVRRGRAHAVEPARGLCDLRRAAKPRRALPEGPSMGPSGAVLNLAAHASLATLHEAGRAARPRSREGRVGALRPQGSSCGGPGLMRAAA